MSSRLVKVGSRLPDTTNGELDLYGSGGTTVKPNFSTSIALYSLFLVSPCLEVWSVLGVAVFACSPLPLTGYCLPMSFLSVIFCLLRMTARLFPNVLLVRLRLPCFLFSVIPFVFLADYVRLSMEPVATELVYLSNQEDYTKSRRAG